MITRLPAAALAAAATLTLLSTATAAHATPVKGAPELTHNALYKTAKLPKVGCALKKGTTAASTRKYVTTLVGCLNKAWKPAIKDFTPVEVQFKESGDKSSCSTGMEVSGSFSEICATAIRVRLADDWIKAKDDRKVFTSVVRTWGGVVTGQTGIGRAWWALENGAVETVMDEHNRRYYLQLDCFFGVSAKSLGRVVKDWKPVLGIPDIWKNRFHGKTANRLTWVRAGYETGGPKACNTWKASSAKVA
ncbi:hypothetical protein [Nonomuraea wenchangensis]|uniref:hypothetical protein n=1 Tax=Nonomuraea wenchangensis TaxID=568860 RepID=UPI003333448B